MNNILCKYHPDNTIIFIIWNQNKLQLSCDECLGTTLQQGNHQDDKWKKLAIRKAFKEPEYFFQQFNLDDNNTLLMNTLSKYPEVQLRDLIQRIEATLKDIQLTLDKVINELKEEVANILNNKNNLRQQLEKVTQYCKFKELIECLNNTSSTITHDVVNQVEAKLQQIIIDLEKNPSNFNQEIKKFSAVNKINRIAFSGIQQFKEQIKQFLTLIEPDDKFIVPKSYFQDFLLNKISLDSKKTIKSTNLILNEQKQNLDHYLFWKKVQNKSNLLMIFKSQSGNIFGAYSPLTWVYEDKNISDTQFQTFLFSYTHKSIHKQNNGYYSLCLRKNTGPSFNEGLFIEGDFQNGHSYLGGSYSTVNSIDSKTHLFGQLTPNIIECRIFQIVFE